MRSSIACARCRRSKVKCVNNGVNTTCRDCEAKGRECTYPTPVAGGSAGVPRGDSGNISKPLTDPTSTGEPPRRPKIKKPQPASGNVSTRESMRALVDALDESILTPQVWMELFEIYQLHYSVDLPFLHATTFLKPLRQMTNIVRSQDFGAAQPGAPKSSTLPPVHPMLLLGFLTLTARFHPQLVAHHSPPSSTRPSNPLIASEYYAAALRARISGNSGEGLGQPNLARVQAILMIATHEWGNNEGPKCFISLGVAIRYAQVIGLQYENDLDDEPQSLAASVSKGVSNFRESGGKLNDDSDAFIEQEIWRRTFWGCLILDRYLSNGKYRPSMLRANDVRLQLPASERAFLFGDKVRTDRLTEDIDDPDARSGIQLSGRTSLLGTNGEARPSPGHGTLTPGSHRDQDMDRDTEDSKEERWEVGSNEGVVSRYIKAMELYGKIVRWSCAGGRRRERYPPWDPQSQWYQLHKRLENFRDRLPRDLAFSQANISAHLSPAFSGSPTPYVLLHAVLLLSSIILHRDYVPFVPLKCSKPQGPLDTPTYSADEYDVPPQWWERSANELLKSARDLINLLQTCREWGGRLVTTPLVSFGLYAAALVGVYSNHFPWMDQAGLLCKKPGSTDSSGFEAARKAVEILGQIRLTLRMADGWLKTISRVHRYFKRVKREFDRNSKHMNQSTAQPSPNEGSLASQRESSVGGGSDEYKMFERTLRDFGSFEDEDTEMTDAPEYASGRAGSSVASIGIKHDGMRMQESSPESIANAARPDRWNAINNSAATAHPTEPTSNGTSISHYQPPTMPSGAMTPSQPASFPPKPYSNASNHTSPRSPTGFGQSNFPHHPAPQHNVGQGQLLPPIQVQAQAIPPPHPAWTAETRDTWLRNLDTAFSGDDIAAFIEGRIPCSPSSTGWLTTVWAEKSQTV